MSGDLRFENHLTLREYGEKVAATLPYLLHQGAEIILNDAIHKVPLAPKKAGDNEPHLVDTGRINDERGGDLTVGIEFTSIYARYIHENLGFKHIYGGQAKFLEAAMIEKQDEALNEVTEGIGRIR